MSYPLITVLTMCIVDPCTDLTEVLSRFFIVNVGTGRIVHLQSPLTSLLA